MKSVNEVFGEWITLQTGGVNSLDVKVPAWIAINNGIEGDTQIHELFRKFLLDRVNASSIEWDPLDQKCQMRLHSLQMQYLDFNKYCSESVSDNELQAYQILYAQILRVRVYINMKPTKGENQNHG